MKLLICHHNQPSQLLQLRLLPTTNIDMWLMPLRWLNMIAQKLGHQVIDNPDPDHSLNQFSYGLRQNKKSLSRPILQFLKICCRLQRAPKVGCYYLIREVFSRKTFYQSLSTLCASSPMSPTRRIPNWLAPFLMR